MSSGHGDNQLEDFHFESPGTGAYRVRLLGEDAANTVSMILAGADDVSSVNCLPGSYTAIIEPIGSGETLRQTIQLEPHYHGTIKLLDAPFEEIGALVTGDPPASAEYAIRERQQDMVQVQSRGLRVRPNRASDQSESKRQKLDERGFSVGLSVRHARDPSRRWCPGTLSTSISDEPSGGVAMSFRRPRDWRQRSIWRLTIAVADDPRWRMRIPLFAGGVQLVLATASSAGGPDISVRLAPRDAGRAALVSNLKTLFLGSAREVIRSTLPAFRTGGGGGDLLARLVEVDEDPWTISAAAIMLAQTDELLPMSDTVLAFAKRWRWIPDVAVLLAWIAARDERTSDDHRDARCLEYLGRIPGRPYFAASQALGLDLLTGLAMGGSTAEVRAEAGKTREKWARISRRQVKAGPYLAAEDARIARSYSLSAKNYSTIATGTVGPSRIDIRPSAISPNKSGGIPALARERVASNDPWKGRFGGRAERNGYRLDAKFFRGPGRWVEIDITIEGPAKDGQHAEFFLHETYRPDRVRLPFKDGLVCYRVLAWGGFTVGGWIPRDKVELELDLSEMSDAPKVIRDY